MSASCALLQYTILLSLPVLMIGLTATATVAQISVFDSPKRIIVIDPGHGGHDIGSIGSGGTHEKTIVLTLSQILTTELQTKYQILLTRTGDYWLDIPSRTAVANKADADIFISIHTGGSFLAQVSGLSFFYFKELSRTNQNTVTDAFLQSDSERISPTWDTLQYRHRPTSLKLAERIHAQFRKGGAYNINAPEGAPILVLRGAEMPAALIEVGYLTHSLDEKDLLNKQVLTDIAVRISKGIDDFFENRP
jgi:N-acetylmuramoyl-L-alanine amidase